MMKKLWMLLLVILIMPLLSGCEIWLFLEDGGGGASGIRVYADISSVETVTAPASLRASLYKYTGSGYTFQEEYAASDGAEVLDTTFKDFPTGTYKVIVYHDTNNSDSPQYNQETGFTSAPFTYNSGGYQAFSIDEASEWDKVQDPG